MPIGRAVGQISAAAQQVCDAASKRLDNTIIFEEVIAAARDIADYEVGQEVPLSSLTRMNTALRIAMLTTQSHRVVDNDTNEAHDALTLAVTLHPRCWQLVRTLNKQGLHGFTVADTVERLLCEALTRHVDVPKATL